jgi:hypothetical protein
MYIEETRSIYYITQEFLFLFIGGNNHHGLNFIESICNQSELVESQILHISVIAGAYFHL